METFTPRGHIFGPILPAFMLKEQNISLGAKVLYSLLCNYASDKDHCWPSQTLLARELGHSVSSVKNWLAELKRARLIAVRRCAYRSSVYVLLRPQNLPAASATNRTGREELPHNSQNLATAYEPKSGYLNNKKKKKKRNTSIPPLPPSASAKASCAAHASRIKSRGGGDFLSANSIFERLWQAYPRKEAKELARAAWHRLWRYRQLPALDVLLAALDRFRASTVWLKEHGRFIPQLVNWLKGQRWQDAAPDVAAYTPEEKAEKRLTTAFDEQEKRRRAAEHEKTARLRPAFEAFLARFADGQSKRGPAWGLWCLLHEKGKAPQAAQVEHIGMGVLEFLKNHRMAVAL